ncbi:hypothetical protein NL676_012403 [Syzygium grande]|nr:hypothetical protein NL676_012403 [Syzygium grande]
MFLGVLQFYRQQPLCLQFLHRLLGVELLFLQLPKSRWQHLQGLLNLQYCSAMQAIAAMAWGIESCPKVEKIFGPGNQYVTAAKMILQNSEGMVSIDMRAGPSEVLVIADKHSYCTTAPLNDGGCDGDDLAGSASSASPLGSRTCPSPTSSSPATPSPPTAPASSRSLAAPMSSLPPQLLDLASPCSGSDGRALAKGGEGDPRL